jgi:hypothetical protein
MKCLMQCKMLFFCISDEMKRGGGSRGFRSSDASRRGGRGSKIRFEAVEDNEDDRDMGLDEEGDDQMDIGSSGDEHVENEVCF